MVVHAPDNGSPPRTAPPTTPVACGPTQRAASSRPRERGGLTVPARMGRRDGGADAPAAARRRPARRCGDDRMRRRGAAAQGAPRKHRGGEPRPGGAANGPHHHPRCAAGAVAPRAAHAAAAGSRAASGQRRRRARRCGSLARGGVQWPGRAGRRHRSRLQRLRGGVRRRPPAREGALLPRRRRPRRRLRPRHAGREHRARTRAGRRATPAQLLDRRRARCGCRLRDRGADRRHLVLGGVRPQRAGRRQRSGERDRGPRGGGRDCLDGRRRQLGGAALGRALQR